MAHNINNKVYAVALDFDGVIANLDVDWNNTIRQASKIAGYDIKSLILFYEQNFGTSIFQKVSVEMEKIELDALKKSQPVPFIAWFLQNLAEKQVDVYIVSMQSLRVIETFLDQQGLSIYVKEIITREKCPGKRAQVEYVAKNISGKVVFVDDSKRNISNCEGLNVVCFYFPRNQKPNEAKKSWNKILDLIK
jgi:phosphoglycolate phosphatase-like HAD superfamily hydrolase